MKFGKTLKISVYNEKYLKAKIKSYNGKINTNFRNHKISKKGLQFLCLSVWLILYLEQAKIFCF